jgi:broad specificity phosphatase PhoE
VLYLIRHGETASNAARVVQTPETPLNEVGIAQAERLARRLAAADITRIVSSDLTRAAMTAEAIRTVTGRPVELDPDLQERNYGDVRGLPYAEVAADILAPDYEPPGGESWSDFHARVERAAELMTLRARAAARAHNALSLDSIEFLNLTHTATLVVACAETRRESRGLHYTTDHPYRNNERYLRDTVIAGWQPEEA